MKKTGNHLIEKLKDYDNFGVGIDLMIQGRPTFNSIFGGIVSLICTIITVTYAGLVTYQLVTFSNCNYMS